MVASARQVAEERGIYVVEPLDAGKAEPFVPVPRSAANAVLGTLGASGLAVYWHLMMRSKNGQCWPSLDDIAEGTRISRKHVTRMLDALEEGGWITRQKRFNAYGMATSTLYTLVTKPCTDGCDIDGTSTGHDDAFNVTVTRIKQESNETPDVVDPPVPPRAKTPRRTKRPIPDDFEPTSAMIAAACAEYGVSEDEVRAKTGRFRRWAIGGGKTYVDWNATWMNWMEPKSWERPADRGRASPNGNGKSRGMTTEEILAYGRGEYGEQNRDSEGVIDAAGRVVERRDHPGEDRGLSLGHR